MKKTFQQIKLALILVGIVLVLLGLVLLFFPVTTLWILTMIVGAILFVLAALCLISLFNNFKSIFAGWLILGAVTNFVVGLIFLTRPISSLATVVLLLGILIIILGGIRFALSFTWKTMRLPFWDQQLAGGLVMMIIGILMIYSPLASAIAINWLAAFGFVYLGIVALINAGYLQRKTNRFQKMKKSFKKAFK